MTIRARHSTKLLKKTDCFIMLTWGNKKRNNRLDRHGYILQNRTFIGTDGKVRKSDWTFMFYNGNVKHHMEFQRMMQESGCSFGY